MRWRGTRRSGALRLSVCAAIYLKKEDDEPIHAIPSSAPGRLAGALGQAGALCSGGGADCRGGSFWLEILATTPNGARRCVIRAIAADDLVQSRLFCRQEGDAHRAHRNGT